MPSFAMCTTLARGLATCRWLQWFAQLSFFPRLHLSLRLVHLHTTNFIPASAANPRGLRHTIALDALPPDDCGRGEGHPRQGAGVRVVYPAGERRAASID